MFIVFHLWIYFVVRTYYHLVMLKFFESLWAILFVCTRNNIATYGVTNSKRTLIYFLLSNEIYSIQYICEIWVCYYLCKVYNIIIYFFPNPPKLFTSLHSNHPCYRVPYKHRNKIAYWGTLYRYYPLTTMTKQFHVTQII